MISDIEKLAIEAMIKRGDSIKKIMATMSCGESSVRKIAKEIGVRIAPNRGKIDDETCRVVKQMKQSGASIREIQNELQISRQSVNDILSGRRDSRIKHTLENIGNVLTETTDSGDLTLFDITKESQEEEYFEKEEWYKFSLKMPAKCKDYLQQRIWQTSLEKHRTVSITEYISQLILEDMEKHPEVR